MRRGSRMIKRIFIGLVLVVVWAGLAISLSKVSLAAPSAPGIGGAPPIIDPSPPQVNGYDRECLNLIGTWPPGTGRINVDCNTCLSCADECKNRFPSSDIGIAVNCITYPETGDDRFCRCACWAFRSAGNICYATGYCDDCNLFVNKVCNGNGNCHLDCSYADNPDYSDIVNPDLDQDCCESTNYDGSWTNVLGSNDCCGNIDADEGYVSGKYLCAIVTGTWTWLNADNNKLAVYKVDPILDYIKEEPAPEPNNLFNYIINFIKNIFN